MKCIIIVLLCTMAFTTIAYTQDSTHSISTPTRQNYLRKSNNQRVSSVALFSIAVGSAAIVLPKTNTLEGAVYAINLSMATGIVGIILYAASIRNRRKAKLVSMNFKLETNQSDFMVSDGHYTPTLSLQLHLR